MVAGKEAGSDRGSGVVIVGGGPAGASIAIRLARHGLSVTLVEREKFPRQKLCGEFISPECLDHFRELDVLDEMLSIGGARIKETRFYEPGGRSISVPSEWLGGDALSLSRARMDAVLLERARAAGVQVREQTSAVGLEYFGQNAVGLKLRTRSGRESVVDGRLFVDATGRSRLLGRSAERKAGKPAASNSRLVGFKAHLSGAKIERHRCEIYGFPGGYGGLSPIEEGLSNHCFLVKAEIVRRFSGNADAIVDKLIFKNPRAAETLRTAKTTSDWLAVSIDRFGSGNLRPAGNVFTVGDSAAFIDPFTGSGMLMALEGSDLLSSLIIKYRTDLDAMGSAYLQDHGRMFRRRLLMSSMFRRAALVPGAARMVVALLGLSSPLRRMVARKTRSSSAPG